MKVIMISKDNCPKCLNLINFITYALDDDDKKKISLVKKEDNIDLYNEYVDKYDLSSVPVLIYNDEVLYNTEPSKVIEFLSKVNY